MDDNGTIFVGPSFYWRRVSREIWVLIGPHAFLPNETQQLRSCNYACVCNFLGMATICFFFCCLSFVSFYFCYFWSIKLKAYYWLKKIMWKKNLQKGIETIKKKGFEKKRSKMTILMAYSSNSDPHLMLSWWGFAPFELTVCIFFFFLVFSFFFFFCCFLK